MHAPIAVRVLSLALAGFALGACARSHEEAPGETATPVEVTTVGRGAVEELVRISGVLEAPPGRSSKLGVLVPGRLAELAVAEGDHVHVGQLLARLEPTPLRDSEVQAAAALRQAQATALNARQHLARAAELWDAGAGPRREVEDAEAQAVGAQAMVRTAEAAVSMSRHQVLRSEIISPLDGVVAHVFAAVGEAMDGTGKPILEVAQVDVVELQGGVSLLLAGRLAEGQPARLQAEGGAPIPGLLRAVSPAVDPATGLVRVRIQVDNRTGSLKTGASAQANLVLARHADVLRAPLAALVPESPGSAEKAVNVVGADGHVQRRRVVVGAADDTFAEIRSGLTAGERVVVGGTYALPDGTAVRAVDAGAPAAGASR